MKAVFIVFNQAHTEQVTMIFDRYQVRGFTRWTNVTGRGSNEGEPHYGSHAWPGMNVSALTIIDEEKVPKLLKALKKLDESAEQQGLRAFVWNIEEQI